MPNSSIKFYHSLQFRLSAVIAAIVFGAIVTLAVVHAVSSYRQEVDNYRSVITGSGTAYASAVAGPVQARDRQATLNVLKGIRDLPNIIQADVTTTDGDMFVEMGVGAWLVNSPRGNDPVSKPELWRGQDIRIDLPVIKGGVRIGSLGMLADLSSFRRDVLAGLAVMVSMSFVVIVLAVAALQTFIARTTAPLRDLAAAMQAFDPAGARQALPAARVKDETWLLRRAFGEMIDRLADRDAVIKRHVETLEQTVAARTHDLRLARDEAEAANAAKSDFLATVSHEIRTPMNGVMVMAELLSKAGLGARERRYAEVIRRSGGTMLSLINDLLDLSKIEAGRLDIESIPMSPETLVHDIVSVFAQRAQSKSLELVAHVSADVPEKVRTDPTRLNQIVANLVNNAIKFTESGSVLVRVKASATGQHACRLGIEVIDTGIGIASEMLDSIFDPYTQADAATTRKYGGTGLGLSVSRKLIEAMGGTLQVESTPGAGSTFRVSLEVDVFTPAAAIQPSGRRVGLVVPGTCQRRALLDMITDHGGQVVDADPELVFATPATSSAFPGVPVVLVDDSEGRQAALPLGAKVQVIADLQGPVSRAQLASLLVGKGGSAVAPAGHRARTSKANAPFSGRRVLAVDDNEVNKEVLREVLEMLGVDVVEAGNGQDALELVAAGGFDLVFMDGAMPVMDGLEATRRIRAREAECARPAVPIIALTAQVAGTSWQDWQDAGASGHVLKPFTLDQVEALLARYCPSSQPDDTHAGPDARETGPDSTATGPVIDTNVVAQLDRVGSASGSMLRQRVWTMFNDTAPAHMQALASSARDDDMVTLASQAHAFKSMALSAGLNKLACALGELETVSRKRAPISGDPAGMTSLVDAAQLCLDESCAAIAAYD